MSRTAALWAGWDRRAPRSKAGPLAPVRGASVPGVPFMVEALGPDARLIIEVAWGADLRADPASWSWTDISADVFYGGGGKISMGVGAADEASTTQPATNGMRVDNEAGRYSLGPQSPNWPNVRRNTPGRIRVDLGAGAGIETLFFGFADGFRPTWGAGGRDARADVKHSGTLRRLIQRKNPVLSPFRRSTTSAEVTDVVAYWPCEEGEDASAITSAVPGGLPLGFYLGGPEFAASSAFTASAPLPRLAGSAWYGPVAPYTLAPFNLTQVRALISFPEGGSPDATVIFRFHTTGTADLWEMRYFTGGVLSIRAWGSGAVLFEQPVGFDIDGESGQFGLQFAQDGADVIWNIDGLLVGDASSGGFGGTLLTQTLGMIYKFEVNTDDAHEDLIIGHITVQNNVTDEDAQIAALNAHNHELPLDRIRRLCGENNVRVEIIDAPGEETVACGFQSIDTLVNLLREAETVDQGILHDGISGGLTYISRRARENLDPFLTLDVAAGDLTDPFPPPADDDQRNINKAIATRKGGSSYTYEDVDGPLGTDAIDTYDTDVSVNNDSDGDIAHYASLTVRKGTVEGYRYPRLELDFTHRTSLLTQWMRARLGGRIDVLSLDSVLTQHPSGTISLVLEGYAQEIDQFRWTATANCSPYEPWQVGVFAEDVGDTNPLVFRYDTDGAELRDPVDAGATALVVVTPSGPPFTTAADDFPLHIDLDGLAVTVTGIAGAASPQTFTVDPATVTVSRLAGSPISVITPTLGL